MPPVKSIAFLMIGVCLLAIGVAHSRSTAQYIRNTKTAVGTVVGTPNGGAHPEIEFVPAEGASDATSRRLKIRYRQNGVGVFGYSVGDSVEVRYDPKAPAQDPCVNTWLALWGDSIFMATLALAFLLFAATSLRRSGSAPQPKPTPRDHHGT